MTKECFEDHLKKFEMAKYISEIYYRKAMFYKRLYEITKFKWAKDRNQYYVIEGQKLLIGSLGVAIADMAILEKHKKDLDD